MFDVMVWVVGAVAVLGLMFAVVVAIAVCTAKTMVRDYARSRNLVDDAETYAKSSTRAGTS